MSKQTDLAILEGVTALLNLSACLVEARARDGVSGEGDDSEIIHAVIDLDAAIARAQQLLGQGS